MASGKWPKHLGITLTPAWKFELFGSSDQQIGNNYAFGGALASKMKEFNAESFIYKYFDCQHQVKALIEQHNFHEKDLIFIAIGSNNILKNRALTLTKRFNNLLSNMIDIINVNNKIIVKYDLFKSMNESMIAFKKIIC